MVDSHGFSKDIFLEQFREIYEGVPQDAPSWIVSYEPNSGVFGSIARLSARQASATPAGPPSIAAHVEHLRWSMSYARQFFEGKHPSPDWSASWSVGEVADSTWQQLKSDLETEYNALRVAVEGAEDWSNRAMRAGTLALVSHGAYHLGAIRVLRKQVQGE